MKEIKLSKATVSHKGVVTGWQKGQEHTLVSMKDVHIYVEHDHPLASLKPGQTVSFVLES